MSQLIRISNEDYGIIIFPVTGREYNPRLDSDVNIKGSLYSRSLWPGIQYPRVAVNIMHVWTLILISNGDYIPGHAGWKCDLRLDSDVRVFAQNLVWLGFL